MNCIAVTILIFFTNAYSQSKLEQPKFIKYSTAEEMNKLAKKYNMPYEVTDTTNNGVLYMFKSQAEAFFIEQSATLTRRKEYKEFLEKNASVRCYDDYFNLIYSIPTMKAYSIQDFGTELALQTYWKKVNKQQWKVYRNKFGELRFIPENKEITSNDLIYLGQRIDNLPRQ